MIPHFPSEALSGIFRNTAMRSHSSASPVTLIILPFYLPKIATEKKYLSSEWSSFVFLPYQVSYVK